MSDGRVQTGHVDGECTHLTFSAGDVAFPVRLVLRDKQTGREAAGDLTLPEAQRAMETIAQSIDVVTAPASRRGIQPPEHSDRLRHRGAGGGR